MKTFIKITVAITLLVSLGFTYMSAKEARKTQDEVLKSSETNEATIDGDNIRTKTYKLVNKTLVKEYNIKIGKEPDEIMFSRCPSGNRARVKEYAKTENEYSYGEMRFYKGCVKNELICKFRARLSDNSVDVLQSDSVNYTAANLWIENVTVSETKDLDKELAQD